MLPFQRNGKIILGLIAVIGAVGLLVLLYSHPDRGGLGIVVATLAAGAGYLFKDLDAEHRTLRNTCQAHATVIATYFTELWSNLSDEELTRFLNLAPAIARGIEAPSVAIRSDDPFALLPDMRETLHVLRGETVGFLAVWRVKTSDLLGVYDQIGTVSWSRLSRDRLEGHIAAIKALRDEYRDIGYTALICLKRDAPSIHVDTRAHEAAGALDARARNMVQAPYPWLGVRG